MTPEQLERACFALISYSGSAKSDYLDAVECAKAGDFDAAKAALRRGDEHYAKAHDAHFDLVQQEIHSDGGLLTRLTLVHAEDQLAASETIRILAEQLVEVYFRLDRRK
jgi:PTS system cellobiose-specific IIA component